MSCSRCGTRTSLWCLGCERVQYCGVSCQQRDWSQRHANECVRWSLVGAGGQDQDHIPLFPQEVFWTKIATMTFNDILRLLRRQQTFQEVFTIHRILKQENFERVHAIFGIEYDEMARQVRDIAIEKDSGDLLQMLIRTGVFPTDNDVVRAAAEGRLKYLAHILSYPAAELQDILVPAISAAIENNQPDALRMLLEDPRARAEFTKVLAEILLDMEEPEGDVRVVLQQYIDKR